MVPQEADQRHGKKLQRALIGACAPDGRCHGYEIVVAERIRIPLTVQVLANRFGVVGVVGRGPGGAVGAQMLAAVVFVVVVVVVHEQVDRELVEADNVEEHPPHARRQEVSSLAKHCTQAGASPLKEIMSRETPKVISVGSVGTLTLLRKFMKLGYVAVFKTMKPVSTAVVYLPAFHQTVLVWPPSRSAAS